MLQITDPAFSAYGRVLSGIDTEELCAYMQKYSNMACAQYIASDPKMEAMPVTQHLTNEIFGEMPLQMGACFGRNRKMNAVEYHDCSEVNIAATDLILFLGKHQDIEPGNRYDTARAEMFFRFFCFASTGLCYCQNGDTFKSDAYTVNPSRNA